MQKIRLSQIKVSLNYSQEDILIAVTKKLKCEKSVIKNLQLVSRAIDARSGQTSPFYSISVECDFAGQIPLYLRENEVKKIFENVNTDLGKKINYPEFSPIIIGAGPAGLLAAWKLAKNGFNPQIFERGDCTESRKIKVENFWKNNVLDEESNVLFGEGGAGLFSDGKLTARSKDNVKMNDFFDFLVDCGASNEIKYDNLPHLGTDKLQEICPIMRQKIEALGGTFHFNAKLEEVFFEENKIVAIRINDKKIFTQNCILAIGHSARDTYEMLYKNNVKLEQKSFAIGIRLEIPQTQIDKSQWGKWYEEMISFGAASYRLAQLPESSARACYSFCMCPGGEVIACASEKNAVTINGMSYFSRDLPSSNAAFLVPVDPNDFPKTEPIELSGIFLQREIENKAFQQNGYQLKSIKLVDFLQQPSKILPKFIWESLKIQIPQMLKKLKCVNIKDINIYEPETRSSSPVKILRDESLQSSGKIGLYPCGEGSGYAGGIVSSAIDGIRCADAIIEKYSFSNLQK